MTIIGALAVLAYGIYIAIVMVRNSEIYLTDIQSKPVSLSVFESFRQVTPFDKKEPLLAGFGIPNQLFDWRYGYFKIEHIVEKQKKNEYWTTRNDP